jgi:hypothetical protein
MVSFAIVASAAVLTWVHFSVNSEEAGYDDLTFAQYLAACGLQILLCVLSLFMNGAPV